ARSCRRSAAAGSIAPACLVSAYAVAERELKPAPAGDDASWVEGALSVMPRRLRITGAIAAGCAALAAVVALLAGGSPDRSAATAAATPQRVAAAVPDAQAAKGQEPSPLKSHPKVVVAVPPGEAPPVDASASSGAAAPQPASDAEIRSEL